MFPFGKIFWVYKAENTKARIHSSLISPNSRWSPRLIFIKPRTNTMDLLFHVSIKMMLFALQ
jgi:hypothetical protein